MSLFPPGAIESPEVIDRDTWATPNLMAENIIGEFCCRLDVAASQRNAKCARFYTAADDGLSQPWDDVVWCNPPYSNPLPWVERAIGCEHGAVLLLPAMIGVRWFTLMSTSSKWWTFDRRIEFVPPSGVEASRSNIGNVLAYFHPSVAFGEWVGLRDSFMGKEIHL